MVDTERGYNVAVIHDTTIILHAWNLDHNLACMESGPLFTDVCPDS